MSSAPVVSMRRPPPVLGARSVFLLAMACITFEAFAVCVLLELARLHPTTAASWLPHVASSLHDMDELLFAACMWILLFAVPLTSIAAYAPASVVAIAPSPSIKNAKKPKTTKRRVPHRDPYFRIFQLVAWTLYAAFVGHWVCCPRADWALCALDVRSTMAVLAFLAESLIVSSILALDRRAPSQRFVVMVNNCNNMLLVVGAVLLAVSAEATRHSDVETREHAQSLNQYALSAGINSVALVVTAVFNTYGLGGVLAPKDGWKFFQPFTGGAKFMLFQAVSWTCFGVGLFIQGLYVLSVVLLELELFVGAMALAGTLFLVSEVVMVMSLFVFQSATPKTVAVHETTTLQQRLWAFADDCLGAILIGLLANTQWIPTMFFGLLFGATTSMGVFEVVLYALLTTFASFIFVASRSIAVHWYNQDSAYGARKDVSEYRLKYLMPQLVAMVIPLVSTYVHYMNGHQAARPMALLAVCFYGYVASYGGQPQVTGARKRLDWVGERSEIMETVVRYFNGKILRDAPLDPKQHYILGFHPHGIMSTSVLWLQFSEQWRALFPGFHANILTASILHQIPLARDILQFFGGREVSRQSFARALVHRESVLLVPGGQAEMLEQRSGQKQVRVYTKHKGFLRLAIEHGTPLVPVLSFKEGETMDNIQAPTMQRWFVKRVAFPMPYWPHGRFGLPVPRNTDICIAVGTPIPVTQKTNPTPEDVDAVHRQYFGQIQALFDKYKDDAGCHDYTLVLI